MLHGPKCTVIQICIDYQSFSANPVSSAISVLHESAKISFCLTSTLVFALSRLTGSDYMGSAMLDYFGGMLVTVCSNHITCLVTLV